MKVKSHTILVIRAFNKDTDGEPNTDRHYVYASNFVYTGRQRFLRYILGLL